MSVSDGQRVNAQTFNAGLASKTQDNTFTGKQTLNRAGSGAPVEDVQQEINNLKQTSSQNVADIENAENRIEILEQVSQAAGSGGGLLPMITGDDSNFEISLGAGWKRYIDAPLETPEDGEGGVPSAGEGEAEGEGSDGLSLVRTIDESEVLAGLGSAKISKPALDLQGEGVALTRNIPPGARGRYAVLRFIYSATENFHFADTFDTEDVSDITVNVLDVTNNLLFTNVETLPKNLDGSGVYEGVFRIASNCQALRVILHVSTSNEEAWDFIFDSVDLNLKSPVTHDYVQLQELADTPVIPPAGRVNIYASKDGKVYQQDSNNVVKELGSGSGGGFMPLLSGDNSNFEGSIGSWATYKDAASSNPEDGTGGTASAITFTRVTDTPLNGSGSARFLTDGDANPQGEGASLDISVPLGMRGKQAMVRFVYAASSGFNFGDSETDSDVVVQLYDVTNSILLNPYPGFLDGSGVYEGFFQMPSDCETVRLILHAAVSNANAAYALDIDEVQIDLAPNEFIKADSDWEDMGAITINATTTAPTKASGIAVDRVWRRKDGPDAIYRFEYRQTNTTGANAGSGDYLFALPPGDRIDMTKVTAYTTVEGAGEWSTNNVVGHGTVRSGNFNGNLVVVVYDETHVRLMGTWNNGSQSQRGVVGADAHIATANIHYVFEFRVPIKGWTSGNLTAASANLNAPVYFHASKGGTNQTGFNPNSSDVKVTWTTAVEDSIGGLDTTNSRYVQKIPKIMEFEANIQFAGTNVLNNVYAARIYKNGSFLIEGERMLVSSGSAFNIGVKTPPISMARGDYIEVYVRGLGNNSANTLTVNGGADVTYFSGKAIEAPGRVYKTRVATVTNAQPSGTGGGAWTHGSYQKLTLNTLSGDRSFLSISDSVVTLQPGTYKTKIKGVGYRVGDFIVRLRDTTNNQTVVKGSGASSDSTDGNNAVSEGFDIFTITSAANFELQGYCTSTNGTDGQGKAVSDGEGEVFAGIEFEKVL